MVLKYMPHKVGAKTEPWEVTLTYLGIRDISALHFPVNLCIGDTQRMTLILKTMPENLECNYYISLVSAFLNGHSLPAEKAGLLFPSYVKCRSDNMTEVQITLVPEYEGRFQAVLQIVSFSNAVQKKLNTFNTLLAVPIYYEAKRPDVSLLCDGKEMFGMITVGSTVIKDITLVNNSDVSVPLRISISNDSRGNRLYFSQMDRLNLNTAELRYVSPKEIIYLLPGLKNRSSEHQIKIPITFEAGNYSGPVWYSLTAAFVGPQSDDILAFNRISVLVVKAKLVLKDRTQNPLLLSASERKRELPVLNESSDFVVYEIYIGGDTGSFRVEPSVLRLHPKQSSKIMIIFSPRSSQTAKGFIAASAYPNSAVSVVADVIGSVEAHIRPISIKNVPRVKSVKFSDDKRNICSDFEHRKQDLYNLGPSSKSAVIFITPNNSPSMDKLAAWETGHLYAEGTLPCSKDAKHHLLPKSWTNEEVSKVKNLEGINVSDIWSVEHNELTIDASNKSRRLMLINNSKRNLKFKVTWKVKYISVSPGSGSLLAKSKVALRINASRIAQKEDGYLEEHIIISSAHVEKIVLVKMKINHPSIKINKARLLKS